MQKSNFNLEGGLSMSIQQLTMDKFEEEVLQSDVPVFVDFYADWCGPCKMMLPIVEEIAVEKTDVKFFKLDIDDSKDITRKYRVMTIPTFIVFKNGEVHNRAMGVITKEQILSLFD
jgi:thioredoxin 1